MQLGNSHKTECHLCHNCKMRKPVELMTKCRNKVIDRPFKVMHLYNMLLLESKLIIERFIVENNSFFIYFDYKGDIKELQIQISKKCQIEEKECNKYFCNFCLRGSYQTNPEGTVIPPPDQPALASTKKENSNKLISSMRSSSLPKNNSITKDWCCPWCLNECFCSRCVRADQIFKLTSIYLHYNGKLDDLKEYLKKSSSILDSLYSYLITSLVVIKDGLNIVRQNKLLPNYKSKSKEAQELIAKEDLLKESLEQLKSQNNVLYSFKKDAESVFMLNFKDLKYFDQRIQARLNELENKKKGNDRGTVTFKRGRGRPKKIKNTDELKDELSHSLNFLGKKREKESLEEVKKKMSAMEIKIFDQLQRFKSYDIVILPYGGKKTENLVKSLLFKVKGIKKRRGRPPGSKNYTAPKCVKGKKFKSLSMPKFTPK